MHTELRQRLVVLARGWLEAMSQGLDNLRIYKDS